MNLKTILFKLGLRKVRTNDYVIVKEDNVKKFYRIIGKSFNIKKDKYNRHESKGRVAVLQLKNFLVLPSSCEDYKIDKKYIGSQFKLIRTKDIISIF